MNNQMLRRLLYSFKRQWGSTFDYVQILSSEADDRTGQRTIQREVLRLPATLMPQQTVRKFIQDIGYLAADKNFTYGALNDFNTITLLVAQYDLPVGFQMDLDGYIVHGGKRFERVSFTNLYGEVWIMMAKGVEGSRPYTRVPVAIENRLQVYSEVYYELN